MNGHQPEQGNLDTNNPPDDFTAIQSVQPSVPPIRPNPKLKGYTYAGHGCVLPSVMFVLMVWLVWLSVRIWK